MQILTGHCRTTPRATGVDVRVALGEQVESGLVPARSKRTVLIALVVAALTGLLTYLPGVLAQDSPGLIDSGRYDTDAAARAFWQPMAGTAPVTVATLDGTRALRFPCNFAGTRIERASWDRQMGLDLSGCRGVQFEFFCGDASPVSYFSLYFQSGAGWYSASFYPDSPGWNRITIETSAMSNEGEPAGWASVRTVRLSAWRAGDTSTEFLVRDFRQVGVLGADTLVALVRCDSATRTSPGEAASAQQFCAAVAAHFKALGIEYTTLSDLDLTAERLRHPRLVVLPHNPVMPREAVGSLVAFLNRGGRLLAFYGMPEGLRSVTKIEAGPFVRPARPGGFAAMRFVEGALPGAPSAVTQHSWNIREPKPVSGASRVIAEWLDPEGRPTGHAAVVASSNAIEMAHVVLGDDAANKRRMLLAMAGYLVPQVWPLAADAALDRVGRLSGFRDFDDAVTQISALGGQEPRVVAEMGAARRLREEAVTQRAAGQYAEAWIRAHEAGGHLLRAFAAAQRAQAGEFRAFWCHSAFGVDGMDWDKAIGRLAENGFTAILPNLLWGGVAFYPSTVLPVSPEVATRGDQLEQCLAACRKHGLQIHVWKVNWNLGSAPRDFLERMRLEGRLQTSAGGKEEPWLCPSHPANQDLEVGSMVEVVRRYPVDGIHFDYIRYPDSEHCFCAGCRERFARLGGGSGWRWPEDVRPGGSQRQAWLDWRRVNITTVVRRVSEQARVVRPQIRISAAVFRNWPADRDGVGQDWRLWCERGWLDFVCPMNYTGSEVQFENWSRKQQGWAGTTPCYPGVGAWELTPERVIGQIQATRRLNTRGFVVFNYDAAAAAELVPLLGDGITRDVGMDASPADRLP